MQRLGVSAQEVSGSISHYALRGHKINKFHTEDGREIDIQVQLKRMIARIYRIYAASLFQWKTAKCRCRSLAEIYVERTLGGIRRDNRQTVLNVVARADKEAAEALFGQVDRAMKGLRCRAATAGIKAIAMSV